MGSALEVLGGVFVFYLIARAVFCVGTFIYTSYVGDWLGITPDYKSLGRWAVVTRAGSGIGRSYALEFARRGLDVVLISHLQTELDSVADEIRRSCRVSMRQIQMDFTGDQSSYASLKEHLSDLDVAVLINNVGMIRKPPVYFNEVDDIDYSERLLHCNCLSAVLMTKMLLPHFRSKNRGVIVFLSSMSETFPCPGLIQYAATKAFVSKFSEGLRAELLNTNVIIQTVKPYLVATNLLVSAPSPMIPTPEEFVRSQLKTVGLEDETFGYPTHKLMALRLFWISKALTQHQLRKYYFDRTKRLVQKQK